MAMDERSDEGWFVRSGGVDGRDRGPKVMIGNEVEFVVMDGWMWVVSEACDGRKLGRDSWYCPE